MVKFTAYLIASLLVIVVLADGDVTGCFKYCEGDNGKKYCQLSTQMCRETKTDPTGPAGCWKRNECERTLKPSDPNARRGSGQHFVVAYNLPPSATNADKRVSQILALRQSALRNNVLAPGASQPNPSGQKVLCHKIMEKIRKPYICRDVCNASENEVKVDMKFGNAADCWKEAFNRNVLLLKGRNAAKPPPNVRVL